MAGWNLKSGSIREFNVNEERIWSLFNYIFSDSCKKRNTYKFGFIKSLLDSVFEGKCCELGVYFSYEELYEHFAENYWNLVVKYNLRQMRKDGKSIYSKVETIFYTYLELNPVIGTLAFNSIDASTRQKIITKVTSECKRCVIGALYEDFDGIIYAFDLNESGLFLNYCVYDFILKYKAELEKLNYYAWAQFLEKINDDNVLIRLLEKLELATPRREDLSIYRKILHQEFEVDVCFYCGKKLKNKIHVDHFIPWKFIKDDKIWNLVLSCVNCNERKHDRIPVREYLIKLEERNKVLKQSDNIIVQTDFSEYREGVLGRIWYYARLSGLKEFTN